MKRILTGTNITENIEGQRYKCMECGGHKWLHLSDKEDDGVKEANYACIFCGNMLYVELPK